MVDGTFDGDRATRYDLPVHRPCCGWVTWLVCYAFAVIAQGCDAQAARDYRGESLLTVVGSVEIPKARASGRLVPALMFVTGAEKYGLLDVAAKGEFPSDFRIDVFDPPPDAALDSAATLAIGYITAVPEDHADEIEFRAFHKGSQSSCSGSDGCTTEDEWCTEDGECYRETLKCPAQQRPDAHCTLETSGDPQLKLQASQVFAGFSQNYLVAYLNEAVEADSIVASAWGARTALPAGYHLLSVRLPSDAEKVAGEKCVQDARDLASRTTGPGNLDQALLDLNCGAYGPSLHYVENPERERISVRLAPDAFPLGNDTFGFGSPTTSD